MANGFRIELGNVLPQSYNKPNVNQLKYQRVQHNKLDPNFKNLRPTVVTDAQPLLKNSLSEF